jgi:photosystem II stability/assembly factor-like uncharacterized protein
MNINSLHIWFYGFLIVFLSTMPLRAQWQQTAGPEGGNTTSIALIDSGIVTNSGGGIVRHDELQWRSATSPGSFIKDIYGFRNVLFARAAGVASLFRSTDLGATWQSTPISGGITSDATGLYGWSNDSLFRSTNQGATWVFQSVIENAVIITTAAVRGQFIVAAPAFSFATALYRSTNQGATWLPVQSPAIDGRLISSTVVQGTQIYAASQDDVFSSADNGETWTSTALPSDAGGIKSLVSTTFSLWAVTMTGVFRYNGTSWQLAGGAVNSFAVKSTATGDILYRGTNTGVERSITNGATWESLNRGLIKTGATAFFPNGTELLTLTNAGIFSTTNAGNAWQRRSPVPIDNIQRAGTTWISNIGSNHILLSSDNGATWTPSAAIRPSILSQVRSVTVLDNSIYTSFSELFSQHGTEPRWVEGGVYRSTNNGLTWSEFNTGFPLSGFNIPLPISRIYSGGNHLMAWSYIGALYHRQNASVSWQFVGSPLPTNSVVYTSLYANNTWWVGTNNGVFRSTDDGTTWTSFNAGLGTDRSITELWQLGANLILRNDAQGTSSFYRLNGTTWQPLSLSGIPAPVRGRSLTLLNNTLYLGTASDGVWTAPASVLSTALSQRIQPEGFQLLQNYPNPFNPSTSIRYQVSEVSDVRLEVFDMLGRKVATLVNARQPAGFYSVPFNAAGLSSAMYFYRLQAGSFTDTKSMMLVK